MVPEKKYKPSNSMNKTYYANMEDCRTRDTSSSGLANHAKHPSTMTLKSIDVSPSIRDSEDLKIKPRAVTKIRTPAVITNPIISK